MCIDTKYQLMRRLLEMPYCQYYTQIQTVKNKKIGTIKLEYCKIDMFKAKEIEYRATPTLLSCLQHKGVMNVELSPNRKKQKFISFIKDEGEQANCVVWYGEKSECLECKPGFFINEQLKCQQITSESFGTKALQQIISVKAPYLDFGIENFEENF